MSKPTDKGDYGLNPSETQKADLLNKEKKAVLGQNEKITAEFESGDNADERQKTIEGEEEARDLGEEGIKSPKGEDL